MHAASLLRRGQANKRPHVHPNGRGDPNEFPVLGQSLLSAGPPPYLSSTGNNNDGASTAGNWQSLLSQHFKPNDGDMHAAQPSGMEMQQ